MSNPPTGLAGLLVTNYEIIMMMILCRLDPYYNTAFIIPYDSSILPLSFGVVVLWMFKVSK